MDGPKNVPDWIEREVREKEQQQKEGEADRQRQMAAATSVREGSPIFWNRFLARLKSNTDALPQLKEELVGSTSVFGPGQQTSVEQSCILQVNRQSVKYGPEICQLNLFHRPGGTVIRRNFEGEPLSDIRLQVGEKEVKASVDGYGPFSPEELADHIVRSMVERVRPKSGRGE